VKLELRTFPVRAVSLGARSALDGEHLVVSAAELEGLVRADPRVAALHVHVAEPGSRTRILRVLDVIEPRAKVEGPGCTYPGFLGPPALVGEGITHRLDGVAVITVGTMEKGGAPGAEAGLRTTREQLIDMSGPGAQYSPFSQTRNVVLEPEVAPGLSIEDTDAAIRLAGLRVAGFLGDLTSGRSAASSATFELGPVDPGLPRVAYICQIQSDGVLRHTFLYGHELHRMTPTLVHPNELLDGALVNSAFSPQRIPTYVHASNRVVGELFRRHGRDVNFLGVVLTDSSWISDAEKSRNAWYTARLARALGAEGAVLTQEAGGNMMMDQMLMCRYAEQLGIKTVVVTFEMGGVNGDDLPLLYTVPEANAMVSAGNREEIVRLPAMERVLGARTILFTDVDASGEVEMPLRDIASSNDQTGAWTVRAVAY
jgi:glycine reductase